MNDFCYLFEINIALYGKMKYYNDYYYDVVESVFTIYKEKNLKITTIDSRIITNKHNIEKLINKVIMESIDELGLYYSSTVEVEIDITRDKIIITILNKFILPKEVTMDEKHSQILKDNQTLSEKLVQYIKYDIFRDNYYNGGYN